MDDVHLGQLLRRGFRWFDDSLRLSLEAAGWPPISSVQSLVFAHIDEDGTTTTELARRIGVTRQAVQQVVAGLVDADLLELVPDPDDRRARLVRLTEAGRRNVDAALRVFTLLEDELSRRIGSKAVADLRSALSAVWGDPLVAPPPTA